MSLAGRRAAHRDVLSRAAKDYADRLGLQDGVAYCTRNDLTEAFLAGCDYVEVREYEREIVDAIYADGTIEVRFGDQSTVELTAEQLGLPTDLIAEVDFHPLFLDVEFSRPHRLHPELDATPQSGISYSASWLRMTARYATDTTTRK